MAAALSFRAKLCLAGSQVICLYSSVLAAWMSSDAPLPKASSMPASFFTRLQRSDTPGLLQHFATRHRMTCSMQTMGACLAQHGAWEAAVEVGELLKLQAYGGLASKDMPT